jgi:hypothetical protein
LLLFDEIKLKWLLSCLVEVEDPLELVDPFGADDPYPTFFYPADVAQMDLTLTRPETIQIKRQSSNVR